MPVDPGTRIGPYEVVCMLGFGGMGEVYKAKDLQLGRLVALKVLRVADVSDGSIERFEQEARAASALNHQNVCHIYQLGATADGRRFIAME